MKLYYVLINKCQDLFHVIVLEQLSILFQKWNMFSNAFICLEKDVKIFCKITGSLIQINQPTSKTRVESYQEHKFHRTPYERHKRRRIKEYLDSFAKLIHRFEKRTKSSQIRGPF